MTVIAQRSFAGGELAPTVHARTDLAKYQSGLSICRNFIVMRHGGVTTRQGTKFLGESPQRTGNQGKTVILLPFTYIYQKNAIQYLLELGEGIFYIWKDDVRVTDATYSITSVSKTNPCQVTSAAHTAAVGDVVEINGVGGMSELNGRSFLVGNTTANTFTLHDMQDNPIDATGYSSYTSGGTAGRAKSLYNDALWNYTEDKFAENNIQFASRDDKIYVASSNHIIRVITKGTADDDWTIANHVTAPSIDTPTTVSVYGYDGDRDTDENWKYIVTAEEDGVESRRSAAAVFYTDPAQDLDRLSGAYVLLYGSFNQYGSAIRTCNICRDINDTSTNFGYISTGTNASAVLEIAYIDNAGSIQTYSFNITSTSQTSVTGFNVWYVFQVRLHTATITGRIKAQVGGVDITENNTVTGTGPLKILGDYRSHSQITNSNDKGMIARQITLYGPATDFSGFTFSVTGEDENGASITETVKGPAGVEVVTTLNYFSTVTSIVADTAPSASDVLVVGVGRAKVRRVSITWNPIASGSPTYNIYKNIYGQYGFIGSTTGVNFTDDDIEPDYTNGPPLGNSPMIDSGDRPSAIAFIRQRMFAGSQFNDPEKILASRVGQYDNFDYYIPARDDGPLDFSMVGRDPARIKHFLDFGRIVVFADSGEWTIEAADGGAITPANISAIQHGYRGCSNVPPLPIGGNAIFIQRGDRIFRDLGYQFSSDNYTGNDLTVFAAHLFDNYTFTSMAYEQLPHSIIWTTRSDGTLLGLTYLPEHAIWGWHRHDTEHGSFKRVAALSGGVNELTYMTVERTLPGDALPHLYIERFSERYEELPENYIFVDSSLTYNGYNGASGQTMTLTGGTTWDNTEVLTLQSSATQFTSADVGRQVHLFDADGNSARFDINTFSSGTTVLGKVTTVVPTSLRAVAVPNTQWAIAVKTVSNLWHLEGIEVSVLGDAYVEASPNNPKYTAVHTVTNGQITLSQHYAKIQVGIPLTSDIWTLDIDTIQGESYAGKKRMVGDVSLIVDATRGFWVGHRPPSGTDPTEGLRSKPFREDENYEDPITPFTGTATTLTDSEWNENARIFIRNVDPIPLTILGVFPSVYLPSERRRRRQ